MTGTVVRSCGHLRGHSGNDDAQAAHSCGSRIYPLEAELPHALNVHPQHAEGKSLRLLGYRIWPSLETRRVPFEKRHMYQGQNRTWQADLAKCWRSRAFMMWPRATGSGSGFPPLAWLLGIHCGSQKTPSSLALFLKL